MPIVLDPSDADPLHGLTADDLRRYIEGGSQNLSGGTDADTFLTDVLASAVTFVARYIDGFPSGEMPADLKDAILALAARRYHERNSGYQDAQVGADGLTNYFRQLPASVQVILDSYQAPLLPR